MQTHEMLGQLPEQEVAKVTRNRIERLAAASRFVFVEDPIGDLDGSASLSHKNFSLFHAYGSDIVISASVIQPVGPRMQSGSLTFTSVIQDFEKETSFIATSPSEVFDFFTDGKKITYFRPPRYVSGNQVIMYPEPSSTELVLAATDDPEKDVTVKSGVDKEGSLVLEPMPPSALGDNIWAIAASDADSMILYAFSKRTPKDVEESRVRLLELNKRLDKIDKDKDLIRPPRRA